MNPDDGKPRPRERPGPYWKLMGRHGPARRTCCHAQGSRLLTRFSNLETPLPKEEACSIAITAALKPLHLALVAAARNNRWPLLRMEAFLC